jgi:hypothetical protein
MNRYQRGCRLPGGIASRNRICNCLHIWDIEVSETFHAGAD